MTGTTPGPATGDLPGALPDATILLHIGPYKTGSTAIQQALFDRREELAQHGVYYPGAWRRLFREGHALMEWAPRGRPSRRSRCGTSSPPTSAPATTSGSA